MNTEYKPSFLSWVKSYEEEIEEFRKLIMQEPEDVHMLKQEYEQLTGKRFRSKRSK